MRKFWHLQRSSATLSKTRLNFRAWHCYKHIRGMLGVLVKPLRVPSFGGSALTFCLGFSSKEGASATTESSKAKVSRQVWLGWQLQ